MWLKPGGRSLRFTAAQHVAVDRVAFSWRGRFPLAGPLALSVVDEYAHGAGRLEVRLLGLPVQREEGPETVAGEALRYLAEVPWAPHAMAANPELEWREIGERTLEVATPVGGRRLVVAMELDGAGDIVRTSSEMRSLKLGKAWVTVPWSGAFGEYAVLGGVRVPTRAEVSWELESGRYVYWRGRVTSVELLGEAFGA